MAASEESFLPHGLMSVMADEDPEADPPPAGSPLQAQKHTCGHMITLSDNTFQK